MNNLSEKIADIAKYIWYDMTTRRLLNLNTYHNTLKGNAYFID